MMHRLMVQCIKTYLIISLDALNVDPRSNKLDFCIDIKTEITSNGN